jgi:cytochrome b6-f complex iron-sulfur subunit
MTDEAVVEKNKMNRREFLNIAWLASIGFILVDVAGVGYLFAMPRFKEGEFGGTYTVGKSSDLPETNSPPINYPKVKFWLSNSDEGVSAIYTVCTHLGCLYNWNNQESKFICPCHGSQFDHDGNYLQGPAPRDLDRFVIQAVDPATDEVVAETDVDGEPLQVPEGKDVIIKVDTGAKINGKPHS